MSQNLSVIVITRNEEHDIAACLESVKSIADEIVLVDSGSTDRTLEIAKAYTLKIFHRDWTGYAEQKQFALDKASGPWVLNIDADERLSKELHGEIQNLLSRNSAEISSHGFRIPYQHFFLGKRLRFGGVQGETHVRLFRKDQSRYENDQVHEGIHVSGPLGQCRGVIEHFSYRDISEYLRKCNEYTSLIAKKKFQQGERFHFWHHLRFPFEFFWRYIIKLGFLDGGVGLTYALLSSMYVWLKYLKLRDLKEKLV